MAYILVSKYDDHLPLYRLNEIFARMGADIPDSTLVDWCGRAMKVLQPLIERIEADIMASGRYADIGIKPIMPSFGLCRADPNGQLRFN